MRGSDLPGMKCWVLPLGEPLEPAEVPAKVSQIWNGCPRRERMRLTAEVEAIVDLDPTKLLSSPSGREAPLDSWRSSSSNVHSRIVQVELSNTR